MKKIVTKKEQDKINRRNQLLLGLILVGLMVFSSLAYAFTNRDTNTLDSIKFDFNGVSFTKDSGTVGFSKDGYNFILQNSPQSVQNISDNVKLKLADIKNEPIYYTTAPQDSLGEFANNLDPITLRIRGACIKDQNCTGDLPVKDCTKDYIIIIREPNVGETERVYQEDKCISIVANYENQARFVDSFMYKILDIL